MPVGAARQPYSTSMAPDEHADPPGPPDPRFLLAAERTFLAWQRTALALVAVGFAAAELLPLRLNRLTTGLGLLLVVAGAVVSGGSFLRHRALRRALDQGRVLPASPLPLVLAATTVGVAVGALVVLLTLSG